jgi:hypothetical protein
MIWMGTRSDRVEASVEAVTGRRAHGGGLKAAFKKHAFPSQLLEMRRLGLPSINFKVRKSAIIGDDEQEI